MRTLHCPPQTRGAEHGLRQVGKYSPRHRAPPVCTLHRRGVQCRKEGLQLSAPAALRPEPSSSIGQSHPLQRVGRRGRPIRATGSPGGDPKPSRPSASVVEAVKEGVASAAESVKGGVTTAAENVRQTVTEGMGAAVESAAERVSLMGEITDVAVEEALAGELIDFETAVKTVGFWVAAATAFGFGLGFVEGTQSVTEFFAGYLLELSLSVDNLFVFVLIFDYFQVPVGYQSKVLTYGIAGAVVFRGILIGAGLTAVNAFEGVLLLFAAVLLFSSFKLLQEGEDDNEDLSNNAIVSFCRNLIPVTDYYAGNNFFTIENGIQKATPLLLTLAVVELSDVFFAFDSIPAVFGVTQDPFIVLSSNFFGILGLRSLYTVISSSMADLRYLQPAIAAVLGFIGSKLLAGYFGFGVPTEVSLLVVASLLGAGVFFSLRLPKDEKDDSL